MLQVFRKRRTFVDFENVIGVMLPCKERLDKGWRKPDGYWGIVLTKSGLGNSQSKRKRLIWTGNETSTIFETSTSKGKQVCMSMFREKMRYDKILS